MTICVFVLNSYLCVNKCYNLIIFNDYDFTLTNTKKNFLDTSNGDAKRHACTYIRLLSYYKFLVSLVVAQFILSYCSCITKTLQAVNCDLGKAHNDVHVSKETIANARNETTWNKVCGRIESIAEAPDITITQPRTISIQRHRSNAGHDQTLWIDICPGTCPLQP